MYGSGCWAQNAKGDFPGVACSTTGIFTKLWHPFPWMYSETNYLYNNIGTGEQIMRTMFTYKCAERLLKEDDIQTAVIDALDNDFLGN